MCPAGVIDDNVSDFGRAQVVGWPPVRSFRRNILTVHQEKDVATKEEKNKSGGALPPPMATAAFVKVSMDGAPYLRKVDLKNLKSYQELSTALEEMFGSFSGAGNLSLSLQTESR